MRGGRGCRVVLVNAKTASQAAVDVSFDVAPHGELLQSCVPVLEEVRFVRCCAGVVVCLFKEPHQILLGEAAGFGQCELLGVVSAKSKV